MSRWRVSVSLLALALVAACGPDTGATPRPPADPTATPRIASSPPSPDSQITPSPEPTDKPEPTEPASPAPPLDPAAISLTFELFADGLGSLTYMTHAGDGSGLLYAVEQAGSIRVVESDGSVRPQPFLDIEDRVTSGGERGLLGLAFHPVYRENGRFFVNYTDSGGDTVVSEFPGSGEASADPQAERILLTIEQPFGNHNGGMLSFGPDGFLYISAGDGGGGGDPLGAGQDLGTLLGKILRIDVDSDEPFVIPADNPFVGQPDARPEIWAYGLRNPWRFSFDRQTGDLFIADVGQNAWEEINAEAAGAGGRNYGWNIMEGPDCFGAAECDMTGLTLPVAWYPLASGHCAVSGGYAYRGEQHPSLAGAYLFADYCSGLVWGLDAAAALTDGEAEIHELGSSGANVSAFGEDEAGELYLVGHGGEILRIGVRAR